MRVSVSGLQQRKAQATLSDVDHILLWIETSRNATASQLIPRASLFNGGASVSFNDLWPGDATVSAKVYDHSSGDIGFACATASIVANQITPLNLNVKLSDTDVLAGNLAVVGTILPGAPAVESRSSTFDALYFGGYILLAGTPLGSPAGSAGLLASDVQGWDFRLFSDSEVPDCNIGVEPLTGQTALVYGSTNNGLTELTSMAVSLHSGTAFNLHSVDICIDGVSPGDSGMVDLVGYRNGNPVEGAVLSHLVTGASYPGGTLVTYDVSSMPQFQGITSFVVQPDPGLIITGALGVDNILAP